MSNSNRWTWWIVAGVVAWGQFLALGAFLNDSRDVSVGYRILKAGMILGCVGAYLAFWKAMLVSRARRKRRDSNG